MWYNKDWLYRKKITIDYTKVENDLVNFRMVISVTDADLQNAQADGDDILFTDNAGNKIPHEIEYFNNATGQLVCWVNVPSVSDSAGTDIYLYFGNAGASNQQDVAGTWTSEYKSVLHLSDLTTSTVKDSSSYGNNMAKRTTNAPLEVDGKIYKAQRFDTDDSDRVFVADEPELDMASSFSISCWVKTTSVHTVASILNKWTANNRNFSTILFNGTEIRISLSTTGANNFQFRAIGANPNTGAWVHIIFNYIASTSVEIYMNGVVKTLTSPPSPPAGLFTGNAPLELGTVDDGAAGFHGDIDELKLSTITDIDYLLTVYANENDPSTFSTFSDLEVVDDDEIDAVVKGQQSDDDEILAVTSGIDDASDEVLGVTRGQLDASSEINGVVSGQQPVNDEIEASTTGRDSDDDEILGVVTGQDSANDEILGKTLGQQSDNDEIDAKTIGQDSDNDEIVARIISPIEASSEIGAVTRGVNSESGEIDAVTTGQQSDNDEIDAVVSGKDEVSSEVNAKTKGALSATSEVQAKTKGGVSSEISAAVTGVAVQWYRKQDADWQHENTDKRDWQTDNQEPFSHTNRKLNPS